MNLTRHRTLSLSSTTMRLCIARLLSNDNCRESGWSPWLYCIDLRCYDLRGEGTVSNGESLGPVPSVKSMLVSGLHVYRIFQRLSGHPMNTSDAQISSRVNLSTEKIGIPCAEASSSSPMSCGSLLHREEQLCCRIESSILMRFRILDSRHGPVVCIVLLYYLCAFGVLHE